MDLILLGMAIWGGLLMAATTAIGVYVPGGTQNAYYLHLLVGSLTSVFIVLTHSLVFMHLEGSGRRIKEDVGKFGLDPEFIKRTKTFKRRASPPALYAMLLMVATAIVGGWARGNEGEGSAHLILVVLTLLVNFWAFPIEIRVARENAALIAEVEAAKPATGEG